jgi:hypothetical protein
MLRLLSCARCFGRSTRGRVAALSVRAGDSLEKASKSSIQSTDDVALKTIQLQEGDSSKMAIIGASLGEK